MDRVHFDEMVENFIQRKPAMDNRLIYLFGHCEASLTLVDLLLENEMRPVAILDNSKVKYGQEYKGIPIVPPTEVLNGDQDTSVVLIVTRFYEAMNKQLRELGFTGDVIKLVDYNTYAEYSLSEETRKRKYDRLLYGIEILNGLKKKYQSKMIIFCPFNALGDIYFTMSYLPAFLKKRGMDSFLICVPSKACAKVAALFGTECVEVFEQRELDATIQAVIYTQDPLCFIAHQDRPYVVNLHKALKIKRIPLEKIYCCGVFGLNRDAKPVEPINWKRWNKLDEVDEGNAVILSPYAKSVTALPIQIWMGIIAEYKKKGYQVFTNIAGSEEALPGTEALSAEICEMKSVLEKAGMFIGIRSGLCDVVRTVACEKIALYPDYRYCDTLWKSIDMYSIEGFDNMVVKDGDTWEEARRRIS